eukprot:TRINITY_DN44118_c0_g1_i1.p1 TRINITY_DN44118_c0_g1~~TRINITY_DN44118_c0_g1_i1.p1  ORF type:complete len:325 (+),score=86.21 TRINITY_DN44118_c0_g1_i1:53-1027(+)
MSEEKYLLRWNDFESNLSEGLRNFRTENNFCDVTLACEDNQLQAHKVILSASSNFFKKVLTTNIHQHPLLYLKGVKMSDLEAIISYIYHGETNVALGELDTFLEVATELQIKGLTPPPGSPRKQNTREPPRKTYDFENTHQQQQQDNVIQSKHRPALKRPILDSKESIVKVKKEYEVQVIEDVPPEETPFPEEDYSQQNDSYSSLSGEIPYDYNQEGANYIQEDQRPFSSNQMDFTAASEVKRLTDQYLQKIEVNGCVVWTCTRCGKQGKMKHHVREHIESNHIDCLTFSCPYCSKEMKNRVALRSHISKNHREENLRSKGLVV